MLTRVNKHRIIELAIALGTILFLIMALGLSAPLPRSDTSEPISRNYLLSFIPTLFFVGFVYLHNPKRHLVNACLAAIFFAYCGLLGQLPKLWQ